MRLDYLHQKLLAALFIFMAALPISFVAQAQTAQPPSQPFPSTTPVPDVLERAKLVWSTMAAVDHANKSGNYSVLRDMAAPSFQSTNNAAQLAEVFRPLRESGLDLSNALLLEPVYTATPTVNGNDLRLQGFFGLRPQAITFDLYYRWNGGRWLLLNVGISGRNMPQNAPESR